eukprot:1104209-Prymnesium_polylepis.1
MWRAEVLLIQYHGLYRSAKREQYDQAVISSAQKVLERIALGQELLGKVPKTTEEIEEYCEKWKKSKKENLKSATNVEEQGNLLKKKLYEKVYRMNELVMLNAKSCMESTNLPTTSDEIEAAVQRFKKKQKNDYKYATDEAVQSAADFLRKEMKENAGMYKESEKDGVAEAARNEKEPEGAASKVQAARALVGEQQPPPRPSALRQESGGNDSNERVISNKEVDDSRPNPNQSVKNNREYEMSRLINRPQYLPKFAKQIEEHVEKWKESQKQIFQNATNVDEQGELLKKELTNRISPTQV